MIDWFTAKSAAVVLSGILLGGMVSFTFFVIPMLRRALKRELARDLLRRLFPAYYHFCTAVAIGAGVATALTRHRHEAVALAILAATFIFARTHLLRAVRALQPEVGGEPDLRFRIVHGFSMVLNLAQMIIAGVLLIRLALQT